jgi:hypothetical protein
LRSHVGPCYPRAAGRTPAAFRLGIADDLRARRQEADRSGGGMPWPASCERGFGTGPDFPPTAPQRCPQNPASDEPRVRVPSAASKGPHLRAFCVGGSKPFLTLPRLGDGVGVWFMALKRLSGHSDRCSSRARPGRRPDLSSTTQRTSAALPAGPAGMRRVSTGARETHAVSCAADGLPRRGSRTRCSRVGVALGCVARPRPHHRQ